MPQHSVLGLLNFYSSEDLGEFTANRALGSTSFLGRYACCDFALSNFTNSGISQVGLLIKEHPRSVFKHLGNSQSWLTNTKTGKQIIMLNEDGMLGKVPNTDINNLKANDWVLYGEGIEYLVFQPAHLIANINLKEMIKEHIDRKEEISIMYTHCKDASKEFLEEYIVDVGEDGYISKAELNPHKPGPADVSIEVWIINRNVLADILKMNDLSDKPLSFRRTIKLLVEKLQYKVHGFKYEGYIRAIDSYEHYCEYSLELLDQKIFKQFFTPDWPHYTLTHDTPPALYGEKSKVNNSFISNGSIVEGTITNSILSRNVKVKEGAVVDNSIILTECVIEEGAVVKNVLIDKYCKIQKGSQAIGDDKKKLKYIKQGSII